MISIFKGKRQGTISFSGENINDDQYLQMKRQSKAGIIFLYYVVDTSEYLSQFKHVEFTE